MRKAILLWSVVLMLATGTAQAVTIMDNAPMLYWDFENVVLDDGTNATHFLDLVESIPLYEVGTGSAPTINTLDSSQAIDFSGGATSFANGATGLGAFVGPWAMELDILLPSTVQYEYIAGCGPNMQHLLWGLGDEPSQIRMFDNPYAFGPAHLNDGQWHKLVVANYGNAAGTEGYVNKLAYSVDGGAIQTFTLNPDGSGGDRCVLGLSYITAGAADNNFDPFSGSLDNMAFYDLSRSVTDWNGDLESQFDAAVSAISSGQQRIIADIEPPVDPPMVTPMTNYGWNVLKDGASFYWSFNESTVNDQAQELVRRKVSDRLSPIGNATRSASMSASLGQAAEFDGSSNFSATAMSGRSMPGAWAVEFWVNMEDDNYSYLLNFGNPDNQPAVYKAGGKIVPFSSSGHPGENSPTSTPGEWQHVVVTYYGDGTTGVADRMDVAVNGTVSTIDDGTFSTVMNMAKTIVGAANENSLDPFRGKIDEVAVYDLSGMSEVDVATKVTTLASHYAVASQSAETTLAFVDSSEISYTYNDGPFGQNGSHPFGDPQLTKLTDGKYIEYANTDLAVATVFGQYKGGEVVFDLGEERTLDSIFVDYIAAVSSWGVGAPDMYSLSFSTDGTTYTEAEDYIPAIGEEGVQWLDKRFVIELDGIDAQFVKMVISGTAEWTPVDEVLFIEDLGGTEWTPGDANHDGKVDGSDVTILAGNWQKLTGATWDMGDFNGDGKVDGSDVTILAGNWQAGVDTSAASVPEPGTLVLLLGMIAALVLIHRMNG